MSAEPDHTSSFTVELPVFRGPFRALTDLILDQKVDVCDVPIARVTEEFLHRSAEEVGSWSLEEATWFLAVCAALLELKVGRLMPRPGTPDEEVITSEEVIVEPDSRRLPRWVVPSVAVFWLGFLGALSLRFFWARLHGLFVLVAISVFLALAVEPGAEPVLQRVLQSGRLELEDTEYDRAETFAGSSVLRGERVES